MDVYLIVVAVAMLAAVLVLMMIGIPLPFTMGACAVLGAYFAWGPNGLNKLELLVYTQFFNLQWTPLILFIFLACIIEQTRIGTDLFSAASKWLSKMPGGIIIASLGAEAGMAACIGSSTTTAIAVGQVAVPEMTKLGYNRAFGLGTLLCGGVVGPLIPPSVPMIVYAIMARESIGQLFIAGIIPGILLIVMLVAMVVVACKIRPSLAPRPLSVTWKDRISSLRLVWPVIVVMASILGGIYFGIMTANEAASVACVIIIIIAAVFYKMRFAGLMSAALNTALMGGMICLMLIAAYSLTYVVATSGLAQSFARSLLESGMSTWMIIIMINIVLLILGCFVDALTIILLTLPFFIPLVSGLGFDLVWFGVVVVVNNEIGMITPPMGLNLFVVRGVFNIPIKELLKGALPGVAVLILFLAIITAFPPISTWLPGMMMTRS
jgi:C4-dicarboxylate transporter, DctM subunit